MDTKVTKKTTSKKSSPDKKKAPPAYCMRRIDASTHAMSRDPRFLPVLPSQREKLPKGFKRVDATTIIKE